MKNILLIIFSSILAACVLMSVNKTRSARTDAKRQGYSSKPLENVAKLPPDFHGNDIKTIYTVLERRANMKKGEYETSSQFEERCQEEANRPLDGELYDSSTFAFEISVEPEYNADDQTMTVPLLYDDYFEEPQHLNESAEALVSDSHVKMGSTKKMSNAFGVTVDVRRWDHESYEIQFSRNNHVLVSGQSKPFAIPLSMSIKDAQESRDDIRALAICKLTGLVHNRSEHTDPTFNEPTITDDKVFILTVHLSEIWLYDLKSGTILKKVKL